jgi:hypothetical protein
MAQATVEWENRANRAIYRAEWQVGGPWPGADQVSCHPRRGLAVSDAFIRGQLGTNDAQRGPLRRIASKGLRVRVRWFHP